MIGAITMPKELLADLIVAVHLGYVAFVTLGFLAIPIGAWRGWAWIRRLWFRIPHLICTAIVALEGGFGILCPLTVWEEELRCSAGQNSEGTSFVGRLLHSILFVDLPQSVLNGAYVVFGLIVIGTLFLVPPRRRRQTG
jgi:hypothetical protein